MGNREEVRDRHFISNKKKKIQNFKFQEVTKTLYI